MTIRQRRSACRAEQAYAAVGAVCHEANIDIAMYYIHRELRAVCEVSKNADWRKMAIPTSIRRNIRYDPES